MQIESTPFVPKVNTAGIVMHGIAAQILQLWESLLYSKKRHPPSIFLYTVCLQKIIPGMKDQRQARTSMLLKLLDSGRRTEVCTCDKQCATSRKV